MRVTENICSVKKAGRMVNRGHEKIDRAIATVFGLGYFPVAPGTVGSLAGLIVCFFLHGYPVLYAGVFLVLFVAGIASAGRVEASEGMKDPSIIVIDEAACSLPAFFFIPMELPYILVGFILFRAIDIIKIPPMKHIEKLSGGWGIMLDDLMAAVYTNIILQLLVFTRIFS